MKRVNTMPTKSYFVYGMPKDTKLEDAIFEFIDNSIKAVYGKRKKGKYIKMNFFDTNTPKIVIQDNCGGISKEDAISKAFRFGNDYTADNLGFGVGMKRALFKLANEFEIYSNTKNESFVIAMNVPEWIKDDNDWSINLSECKRTSNENGLTIVLKSLKSEVVKQLIKKDFQEKLIAKIKDKYSDKLQKEFKIWINNISVVHGIQGDLKKGIVLKRQAFTVGKVKIKIEVRNMINVKNSYKSLNFDFTCFGKVNKNLGEFISKIKIDEEEKYNFDTIAQYIIIEGKNINELPIKTDKSDIDENSPIYLKILVYSIKIYSDLIKKGKIPLRTERVIQYKEAEDKINMLKNKYKLKFNTEVGRKTFDECYRKYKLKS